VIDAATQAFAEIVTEVVEPAVEEAERHPPRLGADGRVEFHPAYHRAGRAVWASGIVGADAVEQASLFYVLAQAGEGGHACPVVCTAGLVRVVRSHAPDELRERFLPPLLETDYDRAQRGAQFLTERHGGSDVGANRVEAVPDGEAWRLHGEKWFCSVADADQFLVTARPRAALDGTRGIGCFLVPSAGGGFRIRRLKEKLGTRALATGEIEFEGALAYALGPLEHGFRTAVGVLNTSRWLNAVGSAGLMRRACDVASAFAAERLAFGRRISEFALVRENLAVMKAETEGALASTMELTSLVDRIDRGEASDEDGAWHRVLVNANKFVTSLAATRVVRRAIETLGGNGTIEDFSPLPRLYRDAIVFESWEGTHNVLCAQVLRDLARFEAVELAVERAGGSTELAERLRRSVAEPDVGALHGRRQLDELVRSLQVKALRESKPPSAELLERRHLTPGWHPEADSDYRSLVDSILTAEP
jgi:alkylation response protein AidB-like acyl-CoA dehydrogenase